MRYSVTLKNAFNHLVNTTEGKQKFHRAALLELAWRQLRGRIPAVPPPGPILLAIRARHETHLNGTGVVQQFVQSPRWFFFFLKSYCLMVSDCLSRSGRLLHAVPQKTVHLFKQTCDSVATNVAKKLCHVLLLFSLWCICHFLCLFSTKKCFDELQ